MVSRSSSQEEHVVLVHKDFQAGRPQLMSACYFKSTIDKGLLKTVQRIIIIIIIIISIIIIVVVVVVVVLDDDTYYWAHLSSDHPFQVYYKVRQFIFITKCDGLLLQSATALDLLLQSATSVITKCENLITKCNRTPFLRLVAVMKFKFSTQKIYLWDFTFNRFRMAT